MPSIGLNLNFDFKFWCKAIFILCAASVFLGGPLASAATKTPWDVLTSKAQKSQNLLEAGDGTVYAVLTKFNGQDLSGDVTKNHSVDYFSAVGFTDFKTAFMATKYSAVSEDWKLENGRWTVTQWNFELTKTGEMIEFYHSRLVKTVEGRVLEHGPITASSEEATQKWIQIRNSWFAFTSESRAL